MIGQQVADAETRIIGCMILDFDRTVEARRKLSPKDFGCKEYGTLFEIMQDNEQDITANFAKFWELVPDELKSVAVGAMDIVPNFSGLSSNIQIIQENAQNRRIKNKLNLMLLNGGNMLREINALTNKENSARVSTDYREAIKNVGNQFAEDLYDENTLRIYTGFGKLDKVMGGLRMGTLSYIGARPSTGKTAFALNIIRNQTKTDNRVLMFSLEMSSTQILERMTSDIANVDYERINTRQLTNDEKIDLIITSDKLCCERLYISDNVYTVEAMEKVIYDYKPHLVVIDFMQFVRTAKNFASRRNEIDYISSEFKRIARQQKCHIMVLSQLSRDGCEAPSMKSLKESGALEQDGDYIILLHRPYVLDKNESEHPPEETLVKLDKNKYGRTGILDMRFHGKNQRFLEVENYVL